jgi:hypothetical protein
VDLLNLNVETGGWMGKSLLWFGSFVQSDAAIIHYRDGRTEDRQFQCHSERAQRIEESLPAIARVASV